MATDGRSRDAASTAKGAAGDATDKAQDVAAQADRHPAATWVKGAGQIANGVVHLVIGGIALGIAFGAGGSADQAGAMQAIRETPLGFELAQRRAHEDPDPLVGRADRGPC